MRLYRLSLQLPRARAGSVTQVLHVRAPSSVLARCAAAAALPGWHCFACTRVPGGAT